MAKKTDLSNIEKNTYLRRPEWLKIKLGSDSNYSSVRKLIKRQKLHTVCESARCPNIGECWARRTATFMILGNICTRSCRFCNIRTGKPTEYDLEEPLRVAEAVAELGLRHAVITSVARDDLSDGGASIFAETIRQINSHAPGCNVEVLIPDFKGDLDDLDKVLDAKPQILNHNLETVERLQKPVRVQAFYERSLSVLSHAKKRGFIIKSGMMVGLGETSIEVIQTMKDLRAIDCDIITIGQYLPPTKMHYPIDRFYSPQEFDEFKETAIQLGFKHVESGPLVRSSYHADEQVIK
ncbi:MAG: lipoyl synthase [Calditrichaceae bacterium]|nr:lipoyl synthase [Calditrichaceae bacterium]MBN2710191.1 lipoyl synthase [Calditrichaceae bacterium]RQV94165.1 MAG: lipoyl synthase [Calditrichota bacterium]